MRMGTHIRIAALALGLGTMMVAGPHAIAQTSASATDQEPGGAYQAGFDHGRADAQNNLPSNNQPREQWDSESARAAYRQGYDAGYSKGSSATAPTTAPTTPSAGAMSSPAGQSADAGSYGYNDGLAEGRKDKDKGHSFRPTDGDMYKNADHGWTADFGDKDHYKQLYRQSYARGYQDGYGNSTTK